MKVFATIFIAVVFVASSLAAPQQENEANANEQPQGLYHAGQPLELHVDLNRFRKAADDQQQASGMRSAYGGSAPAQSYSAPSYSAPAPGPAPGPAISYSYQAPAPMMPCAKNLLLSCAPSVAPVPCSAPSYSAPSSYGSAGAYSEYAPQWAIAPPQMGHYQNFYGY